MTVGDVPVGWTPAAWRDRLLYLAGCCEPLHPDKAAVYRAWADQLDAQLRQTKIVPSFYIRNGLIAGVLPDGAEIPGENDNDET